LRLAGTAISPPRGPTGSSGRGDCSGGSFDTTAPVPASMSALSSSPEKGSIWWVMNSGIEGMSAGVIWKRARASVPVTSSRITESIRSNIANASCLYSSIGFFWA
jgi:hypothetical protein